MSEGLRTTAQLTTESTNGQMVNVGWFAITCQGKTHRSGQIIASSNDLTPNSCLVREILLFQGNLGWFKIL